MSDLILIRYGEIGLKGKNRHFFESVLLSNIHHVLQGLPVQKTYKTRGRVFVETEQNKQAEILKKLQNVFGIVSISPVERAPLELEKIKERALIYCSKIFSPNTTFKIETRRSNKSFQYLSPEISSEIGAHILQNIAGAKVDIHNPQVKLSIEVREKEAYLFSDKMAGPGGLPVSVTGKAILLLSGGIDSPVAGWMGMKRGLKIEPLHFYSFPFTGERSKQKVIDICHTLKHFNSGLKLHIAPFTEIQKAIHQKCSPKLSITIMRRMMVRVAESLAKKQKALCLLTGENLGQVASQTLENIFVINAATNYPILRPLIGLDKYEIVLRAKQINTYPISILPYEDCCTVFVPKHPETRPTMQQVEEAEKSLDIEALATSCVSNIETTTYPLK